ncbi:hypothetical protein [Glycomyces sp. NPDC021274]|jgi:hypothetical protein|uniref:hypothetical protein n=1 Tax=Glycomyces sp. NPDC021274 TaxID=3155120 RepID=UPI0033ED676F
MADLLGAGVGGLAFVAVLAVFSPLLRVKLRRSVAPVAVAVIALVLLAAYIDTK